MTRFQALFEKANDALSTASAADVYQFIQYLDGQYAEHRFADLLTYYFSHQQQPPHWSRACLAAINALALGHSLKLHTHYRRLLAAACCSRALIDDVKAWRQRGLNQPLWLSAFPVKSKTDSYYFCQWCLAVTDARWQQQSSQLTELLSGNERQCYWHFVEHSALPLTHSPGTLLTNENDSQRLYLVTADDHNGAWICAPETALGHSLRIGVSEQQDWQMAVDTTTTDKILAHLQYHPALKQPPKEHHFTAPRALLNAIKRYAQGSGSLEPVIQHIKQRPTLANSLRQAAGNQLLKANDPQRMQLKHIYLWLGAKRASVVLAAASLQYQFMQQRTPLQQSLMQRLTLLTELLQQVAAKSQLSLPIPASLLALLSAADLFRQPAVLQHSRWPFPERIENCHSSAWLKGAKDDTRLSRQLIRRWQLERQLQPLLNSKPGSLSSLQALVDLSNLAVAQAFQPQSKLSHTAQAQQQRALQCLQLDSTHYQRLINRSLTQCHTYSPLTEFSCG